MDSPRTLRCKACGGPLRREDLDEVRGVATCSWCRSVVPLPGAPRPAARRLVGMPRGIDVQDDGTRLRIVRRWFAPVHLLFVVFLAVWFGFLAFWYAGAGRTGAPTFFLLFPLVHVAVGAGLAYVTAALLLNRTVVDVDARDRVTVRSGPVPWRRDVEIPAEEIAQVFTTEKRHRTEDGPDNRLYAVEALTRDGRRVPIVRGMIQDVEQALFLEQSIEERLRLPDRPVAGEFPRGEAHGG